MCYRPWSGSTEAKPFYGGRRGTQGATGLPGCLRKAACGMDCAMRFRPHSASRSLLLWEPFRGKCMTGPLGSRCQAGVGFSGRRVTGCCGPGCFGTSTGPHLAVLRARSLQHIACCLLRPAVGDGSTVGAVVMVPTGCVDGDSSEGPIRVRLSGCVCGGHAADGNGPEGPIGDGLSSSIGDGIGGDGPEGPIGGSLSGGADGDSAVDGDGPEGPVMGSLSGGANGDSAVDGNGPSSEVCVRCADSTASSLQR